MRVAHNPAHSTPPSGNVDQGITPPSLLPARRSESLRRFNYSPGEDDSRWLSSLEEEEEEEVGNRAGQCSREVEEVMERGRA